MSKYRIEKSGDPEWWVLTDTENLVVIKFKDKQFNETQHISILEDSKLIGTDCARNIAKIMREMGEWVAINHGDKCFP